MRGLETGESLRQPLEWASTFADIPLQIIACPWKVADENEIVMKWAGTRHDPYGHLDEDTHVTRDDLHQGQPARSAPHRGTRHYQKGGRKPIHQGRQAKATSIVN